MKAILAVCAGLAVSMVLIVTFNPHRPDAVHVIVECPVSMPRDDCQVILDAALAEAKRVREARREPQ